MMSKISYVLERFELDGMFTVIQINLLQCIAKNQQYLIRDMVECPDLGSFIILCVSFICVSSINFMTSVKALIKICRGQKNLSYFYKIFDVAEDENVKFLMKRYDIVKSYHKEKIAKFF